MQPLQQQLKRLLLADPQLLAQVEAMPGFEPQPAPVQQIAPPLKLGKEERDSELQAAIRNVVIGNELPAFDKRRKVADLVEKWLFERGRFVRTSDGRAFFFHSAEKRLYDLEQTPFQHLLTAASGLSSTENLFRFTLDILQAKYFREGQLVDVHSFSYYDSAKGTLVVSDGAGGAWTRERGGDWCLAHNGDNGLLFLTESDAIPWVPEFQNGHAREWFLDQFLFSNAPLTPDQSKALLHMWVAQQFFPPLRRTRVIPAFLGPQGSGKTTGERLIGRLLLGLDFDVTGLQHDREDAFVAAVTNRVVLGLDNADSKIPFLPDALALYATGQRYRLRRLYTTNEEVSYSPRAILMISSRDPQFNRPDVTERLLPLYFDRPQVYRTEDEIFSELNRRRGAIMGSFLAHVGEIADILPANPPRPLPYRMADFSSFGERVFRWLGKSEEWMHLLDRLEHIQAEFASEGDGLIAALAQVLEAGEINEVPVGDLFKQCNAVAEASGLLFPKTTQGFGQRLSTMRRIIELELGVKFQETRVHAKARLISLKRKQR